MGWYDFCNYIILYYILYYSEAAETFFNFLLDRHIWILYNRSMNGAREQEAKKGMIFSLLLTEQCQSECGHCLFSCTKHPSPYIDDETLELVRLNIEYINNSNDYYVNDLNIIGGEPTINLAKFHHICDVISKWNLDCLISISTNGWFFRKQRSLIKFLDAIRLLYFGYDERLRIRISNSKYHNNNDIRSLLDDFKNGYALEYPFYKIVCLECGKEFKEFPSVCECGNDFSQTDEYEYIPFDERLSSFLKALLNEDVLYVHVQDLQMIPVGRAENLSEVNYEVGCKQFFRCGELTYDPKGNMGSPCCSSPLAFRIGSLKTRSPITMLKIGEYFGRNIAHTCYGCEYAMYDFLESDEYKHLSEQYEAEDRRFKNFLRENI